MYINILWKLCEFYFSTIWKLPVHSKGDKMVDRYLKDQWLYTQTLAYLLYSISPEQNFTLFAPTNEALKKIPPQKYNNLLMNKTALIGKC